MLDSVGGRCDDCGDDSRVRELDDCSSAECAGRDESAVVGGVFAMGASAGGCLRCSSFFITVVVSTG